jgi:hypothetical protein
MRDGLLIAVAETADPGLLFIALELSVVLAAGC